MKLFDLMRYLKALGVVTANVNEVTGRRIARIYVCTQEEYDAIVTKDAETEYNIVEA